MTDAPVPGDERTQLPENTPRGAPGDSMPCDECAAALRRNVLLGIGLGVVLGAAAVFILTR